MATTSPMPHKELTLKAEVPIINKHSIALFPVQDEASSIIWYVELDRGASDMRVSVMKNSLDPTNYCSISIVPCNASEAREWTTLDNNKTRFRSSYPVHKESAAWLITNEDNYEFKIVLSTNPTPSRSPSNKTAANKTAANNSAPPPFKRNAVIVQPAFFKTTTTPVQHTQPAPSKSHHIIASLLKDYCSTDVCFTFPDEEIIPNAAICAHRFVLTPHQQLCKLLFQKEKILPLRETRTFTVDPKRDGSSCIHGEECKIPRHTCANIVAEVVADALARFEVSVVNVNEFSLATFCAFLNYLYTDAIDLDPVTTRFAMFRFSTYGAKKIPLWIDEPRTLSTTWNELLKISIHYGIEDLQTRCRKGVIDGVNKDTAIAILFSSSAKDSAVRKIAIATVVKNMKALFKKTEDPFGRYKDHPDYHDVMMDLMRLRVNGD
ncbi:MAG: hypothetical protein J3R72DRAFT_450316 [Linnemannia gamsii]|nr:MAG: hypothetical protein J3R72DRAFT_450316 [Linnemannia gamsii]